MTEREYKEALLTGNTLAFTRYFYQKRFNRRYIAAKHHIQIAEKLDKVLSGETTRLMINIFPRSGKTELAVKNFVALGFAINPASKFIHLTYSNDLALDNSEEIRDEFIRNEEYQSIFPYVQIDKASTAKNKWQTTAGGGMCAAPAGGAITGFGAGAVDDITDEELEKALSLAEDELKEFLNNISGDQGFNGAIIIDDPLKPDDAFSEVARNKVNRRWMNTIKSRLNSIRTPVIIIGQRLHPEDFCGYVLDIEGEEWDVLNIPALYEDEEGVPHSIWESKLPVSELLKMKDQDAYTFESQYQQNPAPIEGFLYPLSKLNFQDLRQLDTSDAVFSFAVGDPADKGGDYYAMPFCFVKIHDSALNVFVKEVLFNKDGIEANIERTAEKLAEHNIEEVFLESNGGWISSAVLLKNRIQNHTKLKPYSVTINKMVRMLSNYEFVIRHFIFDSNYKDNIEYRAFINNLCSLVKEGANKNDDSGDVLSAAADIVKVKYKTFLYGKSA